MWTVLPDGGGVEPVFQREGQRHSDLGAFSLYSFHLFCVCVLICFFCDVGTYFVEKMLIYNLTYVFYLKDYTITTKVIRVRVEIGVERTQRKMLWVPMAYTEFHVRGDSEINYNSGFIHFT